MSTAEQRLVQLGFAIPDAAAPVANYVPFIRTGNLIVVSGQLCLGGDGRIAAEHLGSVGGSVSPEAAKVAAQLCALNVLAQLRNAVTDLDRVVRCVRLGGFISAAPGFAGLPAVMNGASDLMVHAFGDAGRHARSTVGVAELPLGACVEVEGLFEIVD